MLVVRNLIGQKVKRWLNVEAGKCPAFKIKTLTWP